MSTPYDPVIAEIERAGPAAVYLLHGPDRFRQEMITRAIAGALLPDKGGELNLTRYQGKEADPAEVASAIETTSLLGGRVVIVDDPPWCEGGGSGGDDAVAPLLRYVERPVAGNALVFRMSGDPDRRRRLTKAVAARGRLVPTPLPKRKDLVRWVAGIAAEEGKRLGPAEAGRLVERCREDRALLLQEVAKLVAYAGERARITAADIDAVIGRSREESVFALVDAVGGRDLDHAFELLAQLRAQGEPPLGLLALLARQIRLLAHIRLLRERGEANEAIARRLRLAPFLAARLTTQARRYTWPELEHALEVLHAADVAIKTGRRGDWEALTLALLHLGLRGAGRAGGA